MLLRTAGALGAAAGVLGSTPSMAALSPVDQRAAAAHALNRLGFGPRPGDIARVAADPRAWGEQQLQPQRIALPDSLQAKLHEDRFIGVDPMALVHGFLVLAQRNRDISQARAAGLPTPGAELRPDAKATPEAMALGQYMVPLQVAALESRVYRALESPRQLEEVMVDFWFNHFNVSQAKSHGRFLIGHYEQYAIRPYALGRFADLLHATARHPAMLTFLDNAMSVAPGRGPRGLNENFARELMELHTLGVDGGYTQADVTELARILTGWTITPVRPREPLATTSAPPPGDPKHMPGFFFNERSHDPGAKTWLGHRVAGSGEAEGSFVLDTLARHPSTARHVSFKLAQFFVSDAPPPALVERLARVFLESDGQVVPLLRTLFASDAFWSEAYRGAKFKTPLQFDLSALRAIGHTPANVRPLQFQLVSEGMPLFGCQTPDGYKNTEAAWLNPHAMGRRVEFALRVATEHLRNGPAAPDELERVVADLGPLVTPQTAAAAAQNRDRPALAMSLVLAGPGMMRR
jgi:uncharacterized protein (DUF1800 family)